MRDSPVNSRSWYVDAVAKAEKITYEEAKERVERRRKEATGYMGLRAWYMLHIAKNAKAIERNAVLEELRARYPIPSEVLIAS